MICAALLIGVAVVLAVCVARSSSHDAALESPRRWLVLPDEAPQGPVLALPTPAPARPALPVVAVTYPAWSGADQSWRAEKPFRPWFRGAVPYAATVAFGAVSLDLSALGLGVPEIFPTHLPVHHDDKPHGHAGHDRAVGFEGESIAVWAPAHAGLEHRGLEHTGLAHTGLTSDLFDTHHATDVGFLQPLAWDQPDFIVPSWQRPHEASHDWWA
jgi:hypothetical protein